MKKECPSCAMQVDSKNRACPVCGYEFPATNNVNRIIAILLVLLFLCLVLYDSIT